MSRTKPSKQDWSERLLKGRFFGPYFIADEETFGAFTDRVERQVDPQKTPAGMTQDEIDQAVAAFKACARGLKCHMSPEALKAYEASKAGDVA